MLYKLVVSLTRPQKRAILLAIDIILIALSALVAAALLAGARGPEALTDNFLAALGAMVAAGAAMTCLLGLHKIKLNAYELQGVLGSALVAITITFAGVAGSGFAPGAAMPAHVFAVAGMLFLILTVMGRLLLRQFVLAIYSRGHPRTKIIIYGAGQTGQQLATALAVDDSVQAVAFVDDDPRLQKLTIGGLRVHAPAAITTLVARHKVQRIVLAMPSTSRTLQRNISRRLAVTGCEVHILPSFADLLSNGMKTIFDTERIDPNEYLERAHLDDELPGVSETYRARRILVTGAGGSIGSEICRQLIGCKPDAIVLLDHAEHALFRIDRELRGIAPDLEIHTVLGSVCDRPLLDDIMQRHKVDIVLHAAAYKHVPLVEHNALEGMRNNVLGTKTAADAAREAGAERFILVSTDKAVRPKSAMGISKRLAEMVVQDLATRSPATRFAMVRFGNVLGSSGSVVPIFQEQIANGGPVTLTHADVTRYFMTISEAVRLVLLAGALARGGDVLALDMGEPVSVRKIARKMIESAGLTVRDAKNPDGDIGIRVTGLRPGEKIHEELLIGSDMLTTPHPKILRAQEGSLSEIEMANLLQSLRQAVETRNPDSLGGIVAQWIEKADGQKPVTVNT